MLTDITVILDRSGSMSHIKESTIEGFNDFLDDQRETGDDARITLIQFNTDVETLWADRPLDEAFELDEGHYVPKGGTALNDAIAEGIQEAKARAARSDEDRESLYVVVTDGKENSSKEFSHSEINEMINSEREEGREFIFLASNQNAMETAHSYGMDPDKSMTYAHNDTGNKKAYSATSRVVNAVRDGHKATASFSAEERQEQRDVAADHDIAGKVRSKDELDLGNGETPDKVGDNDLQSGATTNTDTANIEMHEGPIGKDIAFEAMDEYPEPEKDGSRSLPSHITPGELESLDSEEEKAILRIMMEHHQGDITDDEALQEIGEVAPSLLKES